MERRIGMESAFPWVEHTSSKMEVVRPGLTKREWTAVTLAAGLLGSPHLGLLERVKGRREAEDAFCEMILEITDTLLAVLANK